jgi:hypothetical protein
MTQSSVEDEITAVRAALYLIAIPSHCGQLRKTPLPDGVDALLRIVANDGDAIERYAERLEKNPTELREAAAFFLEQIILTPGADSYRVLGTQRHAPATELRRNLVLLCRWLQSDICEDLPRSIFFLRVMQAWNDLKTPERRAAYDAGLGVQASTMNLSRANKISQDQKKEVKRQGVDRGARGGKLGQKEQAERMTGLQKRRSRGLWRSIMFGMSWRAR